MKIIDGKKCATHLQENLREEVKALIAQGIIPTLTIILVGNNPSSEIYVRNKMRIGEELGIKVILKKFDDTIFENELIAELNALNNDPKVHGILVQSPLPEHIDEAKIMSLIDSNKDVDGFNIINVGALATNKEKVIAATPLGIIKLLEAEHINLSGQHVVIVGRSNIVGRPLALALLNRDATVTITHSKTKNLASITKMADILIVAIGKPNFITSEYIKKDAIVIDVGINRIDGKLVGDVDFASVRDKASLITPIPGGVGPMTVISVLHNVVKLAGEK